MERDRTLAAVLVTGAILVLQTSASRADVPLPPVPVPGAASNVGAQPGIPAASCEFPPLAPTEIRQVFTDPAYLLQWTSPLVDPANPCHIYRSQPNAAPPAQPTVATGKLLRADLGPGAPLWQTVYDAPSGPTADSGTVPARSAIGAIAVPGNGRVVVATTGDAVFSIPAVVSSSDAGATWSATDAGLPPVNTTRPVRLTVAPSDPTTELLQHPGDGLLHLTSDGGQHWSVLAVYQSYLRDMQFDPADAGHVFLLVTLQGESVLLRAVTAARHGRQPGSRNRIRNICWSPTAADASSTSVTTGLRAPLGGAAGTTAARGNR